MGVGPLCIEIFVTFIVAATVLYHYGNWYRHHLLVTFAVLIAWYFSMLIVFILPLDVSNTIYNTCINSHSNITIPTFSTEKISLNITVLPEINDTSASTVVFPEVCKQPYSLVPNGVFIVFWRVVYWTSQVLTWVLLPLMQSYTKAGDFTFASKLKSALIDNAIYYGSYLLIVGILLLYIALRPDIYLDSSKLHTIASTASNTWGLFWLVLLLGYGLVEVPRRLWHSASSVHSLKLVYFKAAKLIHEKADAEDHVHDLLQSMRALSGGMGPDHPLRPCMDIIESKVPSELLDKMRSMQPPDSPHADVPSEKALVRLHKQLLKSLQHLRRVETQWELLVPKVLHMEDSHKNAVSPDKKFRHSFRVQRHPILEKIYTPTIEWYCRCLIRRWVLCSSAVILALVSFCVVWSELTFFVKQPTLSLFANFVHIAQNNSDYFTIELISSLTMAYIALCAYYTLFQVRILNLYYLAPHHLTDEYSLIFSGMMLCRLTPPMCLNFLSLIHMDSHVIDKHQEETSYTQIMGHMDVISIISDGFNVYFPMMIVALCLATYYNLGSKLLSALGFQQFIGDNDLTSDLVDEGRTLVAREARKLQRQHDSAERRKNFTDRFGGPGESTSSMYRAARERAERLVSPIRKREATETSHLELLGETPPTGPPYTQHTSFGRDVATQREGEHRTMPQSKPDKALFDDV